MTGRYCLQTSTRGGDLTDPCRLQFVLGSPVSINLQFAAEGAVLSSLLPTSQRSSKRLWQQQRTSSATASNRSLLSKRRREFAQTCRALSVWSHRHVFDGRLVSQVSMSQRTQQKLMALLYQWQALHSLNLCRLWLRGLSYEACYCRVRGTRIWCFWLRAI